MTTNPAIKSPKILATAPRYINSLMDVMVYVIATGESPSPESIQHAVEHTGPVDPLLCVLQELFAQLQGSDITEVFVSHRIGLASRIILKKIPKKE